MLNIEVRRKLKTADGVFGDIFVNDDLTCESCENSEYRIPIGIYQAKIDMSPRLGYECPHIAVPSRDSAAPGGDAGIRIHIFNEPRQGLGCIATGTEIDRDAVDDSRIAFNKLMTYLPIDQPFQITITSLI